MPGTLQEPMPKQAYPYPWCIPEPAHTGVRCVDSEQLDGLDRRDVMLRDWFREFSDKRNGGITPPPMH